MCDIDDHGGRVQWGDGSVPVPNIGRMGSPEPSLSIVTGTELNDVNNISTPAVDLSSYDQYGSTTSESGNGTTEGLLSQFIWLSYNDGSGAKAGVEIRYLFYQGGLGTSSTGPSCPGTDWTMSNWSFMVCPRRTVLRWS